MSKERTVTPIRSKSIRILVKNKSLQYNYGECEICDAKMVERRIKQDFRIRGTLVVIDNVPAGVCSQCGARVVRAEIGKRLAAILKSPGKWAKAAVINVPVVDLRP